MSVKDVDADWVQSLHDDVLKRGVCRANCCILSKYSQNRDELCVKFLHDLLVYLLEVIIPRKVDSANL